MNSNPKDYLDEIAGESIANIAEFTSKNGTLLVKIAALIAERIDNGNKVLIFGNGGSAADAQHMAAEMVGRMLKERRPLPAIALTTDTSTLTAIGNDYGFEEVFASQVQALAKPWDVVIAITTSGNSLNVLRAIEEANAKDSDVIILTGANDGAVEKYEKRLNVKMLRAPGANSCRIQEVHGFIIHALVDLIDRFYLTTS